jgi:hypothetical protein
VVHEFFEDIDWYPGVGMALGVGMPQRVGGHEGTIERGGLSVRAQQFAVEGLDLLDPGVERPAYAG